MSYFVTGAKVQQILYMYVEKLTEITQKCAFLLIVVVKTALHKCILHANENSHNACSHAQ